MTKFIPSYVCAVVSMLGAGSIYLGWFEPELSFIMFRYGLVAMVLSWFIAHEVDKDQVAKRVCDHIDRRFDKLERRLFEDE